MNVEIEKQKRKEKKSEIVKYEKMVGKTGKEGKVGGIRIKETNKNSEEWLRWGR